MTYEDGDDAGAGDGAAAGRARAAHRTAATEARLALMRQLTWPVLARACCSALRSGRASSPRWTWRP